MSEISTPSPAASVQANILASSAFRAARFVARVSQVKLALYGRINDSC